MTRLLFLLALLFASSACDSIPKDPEGTLQRVRDTDVFRVGLIASGLDHGARSEELALIERVAAASGARAEIETDAAERLLMRMEEGEFDLVVGEFLADSPWRRRVHMLQPLDRSRLNGIEVQVTGAARQGENAWIMLLEREARSLADQS